MEITLSFYDKESKKIMVTKKLEPHLLNINYNNPSKVCDPCAEECKKINKKVNNRKLSEIKDEEVAHIFLSIFENKV